MSLVSVYEDLSSMKRFGRLKYRKFDVQNSEGVLEFYSGLKIKCAMDHNLNTLITAERNGEVIQKRIPTK